MKATKEDILLTSLHLFARDGYEAVSVSQIAGELGMTKGALYRHFESKRDIFDHILRRMEQGDADQAEDHDMPEGTVTDTPEAYQNLSVKDFLHYSLDMFAYWTEDDFASSFRKMLTIEQFRNEEMQGLYQQYLAAGPLAYVKDLFVNMGVECAEEKALQFYSCMFFFYSLYDGSEDKKGIKRQFEQVISRLVE